MVEFEVMANFQYNHWLAVFYLANLQDGFIERIENLNKAPYFPKNKTFLVNEFASGSFIDILKVIQDQLNFTSLLYKHEETAWGDFQISSNGSINGTGIVGDVYFKRADLASAAIAMTQTRLQYIDYLPPLAPYELGLYISSNDISLRFDYLLFFKPFNMCTWITIIISSMVFALTKSLILESNGVLYKSVSYIWTSFMGFCGQASSDTNAIKESYRQTVFVTLLFGQIFWICYSAFLTSDLAITEKKYPFNDLKGLSNTEWR